VVGTVQPDSKCQGEPPSRAPSRTAYAGCDSRHRRSVRARGGDRTAGQQYSHATVPSRTTDRFMETEKQSA